jgi:hypothetical protein
VNEIRLILDRSALLAFAKGRIAVGETLAEVIDEGDLYATPVTTYVDVMRFLEPEDLPPQMRQLVQLLFASPSARLLPILPGDAEALLYWIRRVGEDVAPCVVALLAHPHCYMLTAEPEWYEDELGDGSYIQIED